MAALSTDSEDRVHQELANKYRTQRGKGGLEAFERSDILFVYFLHSIPASSSSSSFPSIVFYGYSRPNPQKQTKKKRKEHLHTWANRARRCVGRELWESNGGLSLCFSRSVAQSWGVSFTLPVFVLETRGRWECSHACAECNALFVSTKYCWLSARVNKTTTTKKLTPQVLADTTLSCRLFRPIRTLSPARLDDLIGSSHSLTPNKPLE